MGHPDRNSATNTAHPRQRVDYRDAEKVRERIEAAAAALRCRGARRHVLAAVLKLLCGWSKLTDDRVALTQIAELITAAGARRYDLKTIGRALASLSRDDLIVYRPAQGRGTRAFIAIHDRYIGGVQVLERDASGRVIIDYSRGCKAGSGPGSAAQSVTFSGARPYKYQNNYPPTPRNETPPNTSRPTEVKIRTTELRAVLADLPEPLHRLPRHLRWKLGAEIRRRLLAGWRPDQVSAILAAPMPADMQRPWRLAMWRLQHNLPGSGPRRAPLQRAWDTQQATAARADAENTTARWHAEVEAVTTAELRAELLRADQVKFGRTAKNPRAVLAGAGRRVARLFPHMPLAAALQRWADEVLDSERAAGADREPADAPTSLGEDLLRDLAIGGGCSCVVCGSQRGVARPELPLEALSTVCDRCWPHIAAQLVTDVSEVAA
ncbi:MAG: hypothetical protein K0U84_20445 [Actinomycetia bacterium]|nr:hypothetical protein [Actinomycetes bacterium]